MSPAPEPKTTPKTPHDKSLEDTFPASDPVPLKPPRREGEPRPPGEHPDPVPKVEIAESAMPPEKPV